MFGESSYKNDVAIFGRTVNLEKAAGTLNQYVALNTLSFNMLQGGNQYILDNLSLVPRLIYLQEFQKLPD